MAVWACFLFIVCGCILFPYRVKAFEMSPYPPSIFTLGSMGVVCKSEIAENPAFYNNTHISSYFGTLNICKCRKWEKLPIPKINIAATTSFSSGRNNLKFAVPTQAHAVRIIFKMKVHTHIFQSELQPITNRCELLFCPISSPCISSKMDPLISISVGFSQRPNLISDFKCITKSLSFQMTYMQAILPS